MGNAALYRLPKSHRHVVDVESDDGLTGDQQHTLNIIALVLALLGLIGGLIATSNLSPADIAATFPL
jgi:hypothetical protein